MSNNAAILEQVQSMRLFNQKWYEKAVGKTFETVDLALAAFLADLSVSDRDPNPLFNSIYYRTLYAADIPNGMSAFEHYLSVGLARDHQVHPAINVSWVKVQLQARGLTDGVLPALLHKCAALELDPHPCFSVRFYLRRYPEVQARRAHPIIHYIENGVRENRSPHPLYWPEWVKDNSGSKQPIGVFDFVANESFADTDPNPYFDSEFYLMQNPDVAAAKMNPLQHYLNYGWAEGRTPHPDLDINWFKGEFGLQLRLLKSDPLSFVVMNDNGVIPVNIARSPIRLKAGRDVVSLRDYRRKQFGSEAVVSTSRKRIAFFSHNLRFQGAQNSLFELASGVNALPNHEVVVLAPDHGPLKEAYAAAGIDVQQYRMPVRGMEDATEYEKIWKKFRDQIASFAPDVVHCNTVQTYHAIAAADDLGIPSLWNIRESEPPNSHFDSLHATGRAKLESAIKAHGLMVFVAESTAQLWRTEFPTIRHRVIQNGINYNRLAAACINFPRTHAREAFGIGHDDVVFLNVGTWTERKGQLDIVKALLKISPRHWSKIVVILVGANESEYAAQIRAAIAMLPSALAARLRVVPETAGAGERLKALAAYRASDVFLMTSRIESYPRVVNEALFFGMPVISTRCFGTVEQITEGDNGLFYEAGDEAALASRMSYLLSDSTLRAELARNASYSAHHKLVQYNQMIELYRRCYGQLLAGAGTRKAAA